MAKEAYRCNAGASRSRRASSETPPLPAEFDDALSQGLGVLDLELTPEARETIEGHVRLLLAWTVAINLTAIRAPAAVALSHVVDSLTGHAPIAGRRPERVSIWGQAASRASCWRRRSATTDAAPG